MGDLGYFGVLDAGGAPAGFVAADGRLQDFAQAAVAAPDGYAAIGPVFQAANFPGLQDAVGLFLRLG